MSAPEAIVTWRGPVAEGANLNLKRPPSSNKKSRVKDPPNGLHAIADGGRMRLCSAWREEIGTSSISCPVCHVSKTRRSRRRSVPDYLFGFAGILPWRCESCALRFYARPMSFRIFLYAHCRICGNLELQRISAERMQGIMAILGRVLGIPALRCEPCRHKFFSVRPLRREERPVAISHGE